MELVLFICGAWCAVLGFVVSLLAVASRTDARLAEARRARRGRVPGFTKQRQEGTLPAQERPLSRA